MSNPAAKYTDEFRRETADYIISTGRPITECCAELGLNSKTVNKWVQNRRRRPQAQPVLRQRCQKRPSKGRVPLDRTIGTPPLNDKAYAFAVRKKTLHLLPVLKELVQLAVNCGPAFHSGLDDEPPSVNDVLYRAQCAQVVQRVGNGDDHVSILPHLD